MELNLRGGNFGRFFNNPLFADIRIRTGVKTIHASRLLLSVASPVFRTMFFSKNWAEGKGEIAIEGLSPATVEGMILWIYLNGNTSMDADLDILELFAAAHMYGIRKLQDWCERKIISEGWINGDSILAVWGSAKLYGNKGMMKAVQDNASLLNEEKRKELMQDDSDKAGSGSGSASSGPVEDKESNPAFWTFFNEQAYSDLKIRFNGETIYGSKLLFALASPKFRRMIEECDSDELVIAEEALDKRTFHQIMEWVYFKWSKEQAKEELNREENYEQCPELLRFADKYRVTLLKRDVERKLARDVEFCLELDVLIYHWYALGKECNSEILIDAAIEELSKHDSLGDIMMDASFREENPELYEYLRECSY